MAKKPSSGVDAIHHNDTRTNIPTEELRDFVAQDERAPKTMLYPRDPSLDPQLVWKGKDEQDAADLAVPVVPIYIQEKIHPQALVADLLAQYARPGQGLAEANAAYQLNLFADFNGLPEEFDQRVDFYQHEGHWSNRMILGDSLLVMTSLAEKEGLKGKVQTIYLDPPYGIKFGSNWQVSTRKRDVKDGKAEDATRQPEQVRAFRDTWKLGIHSYLAYLRDRLVTARELLTETGSIFVQIGDENVHLVRCVLDEVFGSENFCSQICVKKTAAQTDETLSSVADYLVWYAKNREHVKLRSLFQPKQFGDRYAEQYRWVELPDGTRRRLNVEEQPEDDWRVFRPDNLTSSHEYSKGKAAYEFEGKTYGPAARYWSTSPEGINRLDICRRLVGTGKTLSYLRYLDDFGYVPLLNLWTDTGTGGYGDERYYVVQTTTKVIQRCLLMTTDPGDLVLDPTCGSGTTAYVAEQWGRRWITVDTSRVALALARTRLMTARYPYYHLAGDYPQITQMNTDEAIKNYLRTSAKSADSSSPDIRKGFVYRRVPHVTLKSIANNPDIHEGMTRAEIDAAIAKHADTETLFDQPYEDNKRVRVCGPFSVESLSPHRVLSTADDDMDGTVGQQEAQRSQDFATMILENLRKSPVQTTRKAERLKFDRLDPYAGRWLQATGEYTDADGKIRRVAVSIGPEHGTVGPDQVKEAAKEAVQGLGHDLLLVCGFAFDPHVSEEAKRYGALTVLPTKMNPDLSMGDELLKKTGAGNLFMVFGEPDVEIRRIHPQMAADRGEDKPNLRSSVKSADSLLRSCGDQIIAEIRGVDVYDPTTGQIRSASTDDIACWFIDTDYNGESFFVRHAYFTGAEEPYDNLKRALRAEIDEAAWSSLYSTVSRPFPAPVSGKIAVKVINHYGDEVLKVFPV
jgi:adenine-specific DNA-methyltransferase